MNIDEIVAAEKLRLEQMSQQRISKLQADHKVTMDALYEEAQENMRSALDRALATYEEQLRKIDQRRQQLRRGQHNVPEYMLNSLTRLEDSAKKAYERSVESIKGLYKHLLGIE